MHNREETHLTILGDLWDPEVRETVLFLLLLMCRNGWKASNTSAGETWTSTLLRGRPARHERGFPVNGQYSVPRRQHHRLQAE